MTMEENNDAFLSSRTIPKSNKPVVNLIALRSDTNEIGHTTVHSTGEQNVWTYDTLGCNSKGFKKTECCAIVVVDATSCKPAATSITDTNSDQIEVCTFAFSDDDRDDDGRSMYPSFREKTRTTVREESDHWNTIGLKEFRLLNMSLSTEEHVKSVTDDEVEVTLTTYGDLTDDTCSDGSDSMWNEGIELPLSDSHVLITEIDDEKVEASLFAVTSNDRNEDRHTLQESKETTTCEHKIHTEMTTLNDDNPSFNDSLLEEHTKVRNERMQKSYTNDTPTTRRFQVSSEAIVNDDVLIVSLEKCAPPSSSRKETKNIFTASSKSDNITSELKELFQEVNFSICRKIAKKVKYICIRLTTSIEKKDQSNKEQQRDVPDYQHTPSPADDDADSSRNGAVAVVVPLKKCTLSSKKGAKIKCEKSSGDGLTSEIRELIAEINFSICKKIANKVKYVCMRLPSMKKHRFSSKGQGNYSNFTRTPTKSDGNVQNILEMRI